MKRITAILLAFCLMLSLTACSTKRADNKNANLSNNIGKMEVDAISVSMEEDPSSYGMKELEYDNDLWISSFSLSPDSCYFIGNLMDKYEIRRLNLQSLSCERINSFNSEEYIPLDISVSSDGFIFVLVRSNAETESAAFEWRVLKLTDNGEIITSYPLNMPDLPENWNPDQILVLDDLTYLLGGGQLCAVRLNDQATIAFQLQTLPSAVMTVLSDGCIVVGQNERDAYNLYRVDAKAAQLGNKISFNLPFVRMQGGHNSDVFLDDGNSLYVFSFVDGSFKKLFTWNGLGIVGDRVAELEDGSFLCAGRQSTLSPGFFVQISEMFGNNKAEKSSSPIVLATVSAESIRFDVKEAIRQWNSSHPDTPIEIRDYAAYYDGQNPRSAELKMTADLIAGNLPDIYDLSTPWTGINLSTGPLVRRGMLENLYPYIDRDSELSRNDFFPGVLSGLEINNGLYELVLNYRVITSFGYSPDVGAAENWTYGNLNRIVNDSDYYTSLFTTDYNRLEWLQMVIAASGPKLINWDTFECDFTSDYFINLLQVAAQMPTESEGAAGGVVNELIQNGTGVLFLTELDTLWAVISGSDVYRENCSYVGLPELGTVIRPETSFGISSCSSHKDECWEFLRQFLLPGDTVANRMDYSMRPDVMNAHLAKEMTQAQEQGYADKHPYAETAMRTLLGLLNNPNVVYRQDPQIWEIVNSEVGAYFSNQRSAEETARIIQSRASLYLAEQR